MKTVLILLFSMIISHLAILLPCVAEQRDRTMLYEAIAEALLQAKIPGEERLVLSTVFRSKRARNSGLTDTLAGRLRLYRLVWSGHLIADGRRLFLFDEPPLPEILDVESPVIAVVTDRGLRFQTGQKIASFSAGVVGASLNDCTLSLITRANWICRVNVFEYKLVGARLVESSHRIDEPNGSWKTVLTGDESDLEALRPLLAEVRKLRATQPIEEEVRAYPLTEP